LYPTYIRSSCVGGGRVFSQAITDNAPFVDENTLDVIFIVGGVSGGMKKRHISFFFWTMWKACQFAHLGHTWAKTFLKILGQYRRFY